jgi:PhoPQ-activated pathogenicity-related protein
MTIDSTRQIDTQSIIRYANRFTLPLPDVFIENNQLQPKDEMEIYRDRVNGHDALIIIPKKSVPVLEEVNS